MAQRLPFVNGDDGTWGTLLNAWLKYQHVDSGVLAATNGGHQYITIVASDGVTGAPINFNSGTVLSTQSTGAMEFNTDTLFFTITTGTARNTIAMFNDGSGAHGDIYYRSSNAANASGPLVRLPIGSSGQYLGVSSGVPAWNNLTYAIATKTTGYSLTTGDCVIFANASTGNVTITLPLSSTASGFQFTVKRIDNSANTCSVTTTNPDTIDGQTTINFSMQYASMTMVSNGSSWYII
jgi:hypothetical protein